MITGGGGGGAGGGAGGGGGGGGGGAGGTGGAGGGGGAILADPGGNARGGDGGGGGGGKGAAGGKGGDGGKGGSGGGAFEIVANGRINLNSTTNLNAKGGQGGSGSDGSGPNPTTPQGGGGGANAGTTGAAGADGSGVHPGGGGFGGGGGNGGAGGTGGTGGSGGAGAGGAGGTIKLFGSVVNAAGATVNTQGAFSGDFVTVGVDGQLLIGSNTPVGASSITKTGVGNLVNLNSAGSGATAANPFVKNPTTGNLTVTPMIAGLQGGAETYGLVSSTFASNLLGDTTYSNALNTATSNAVVMVLREAVPTSFGDQYVGFDYVFYVNMTGETLGTPQLGVTEGSANSSTFNPIPALEYQGVLNNPTFLGSGPKTISVLPAHGIWATMVPHTDPAGGQFLYSSLSGPVDLLKKFTGVVGQGQQLEAGKAFFITAQRGTQVSGLQLPGLTAITVTPDAKNVYALSVAKNILVVANGDLSQRQTVAVSGLTAASKVVLSPDGKNVYVTEPTGGNVVVFTRNTATGALTVPALQSFSIGGLSGSLTFNSAGTKVFTAAQNSITSYQRNADGSLNFLGVNTLNGLGAISDMALSQDGQFFYVASRASSNFFVLNSATVAIVSSFSASPANGLQGASAIAVSHDDNYIYVTGEDGGTLTVVQRTGASFTVLQTLIQGLNGVRGLIDPNAVAVSNDASSGHQAQDKFVYVTGGLGNTLAVFARQSDGTLQAVQTDRGAVGLNSPGGLAEDASGTVYVASQLGFGVSGGGIATFTPVPPVVITAASWLNNTATITADNSFKPGQTVTVAGISGSLVPAGYNGDVVVLAVITTAGKQTGFTYLLATNPGTATLNNATASANPRTTTVTFNKSMDAVTLTTGSSPDTINELHAPDVAVLNINAGDGSNAIGVLGVTAPGLTTSSQTVTVTTGTGPDNVTVFAGRPNDTYNINTGDGADFVKLSGDLANDANVHFTVNLGNGDDTAQIAGTSLASSDVVNIFGGVDNDTLLYDAGGNPITPGTPITPDGSITTSGISKATINYTGIESIPGFVAGTASAGGPYTITEGGALSLSGSASAATGTTLTSVSWDLNGDGTFGDAGVTTVTTSTAIPWSALVGLGITHNGTYTIAIQVLSSNNTSATAFGTLVVNAAKPTINVTGNATANVGETYNLGFTATFGGDEKPLSWIVNWGDGTPNSTLPSDATGAPHTYTTVNSFNIQVSVTDVNGLHAPSAGVTGGTKSITTVINPNAIGAGGPYIIDEGGNLVLISTANGVPTSAGWDLKGQSNFTDATGTYTSNGNGTSTSTLTLTWAQLQALGITDSTPTGTPLSVKVKALYPTTAVAAGFLISLPTTLTIRNVAPIAALTGSAQEGGTGSVTFSAQSDPANADTLAGFKYSYDVGNTGAFLVTDSASPTFAIPASNLIHTGTVVVRGRIADKDGAFTDSIVTVPITDQPPTILTVDAAKTVIENSSVTLDNVTFSDPGADTITASINWGDNSSSQGLVTTTNTTPAPTTGMVSGSHTFAFRATPYTVTITIRDSAGAPVSRSFQVTVQDPPLTLVAGPGQSVNEGDLVTLTGATFTDPGAPDAGTYAASVNWGDGTATDLTPNVSAPPHPPTLAGSSIAIITAKPELTRLPCRSMKTICQRSTIRSRSSSITWDRRSTLALISALDRGPW